VRSTARCLIVGVTILSWIAISNHCTLRAFAGKIQPAGGCPFHAKSSQPQPKSPATECCKILRAVPATPANNLAPAIIDLLPIDKPFHQIASADSLQISLAPATLDTGPPGKTSFVELTGSLRAHAPPCWS